MWPENWPVFDLFHTLMTQWTVSMNGPTGLRYEAAYPLIDRMTTTPDEWSEVFEDLRELEYAALKQLADQRQED